jgi:hypothetical protein
VVTVGLNNQVFYRGWLDHRGHWSQGLHHGWDLWICADLLAQRVLLLSDVDEARRNRLITALTNTGWTIERTAVGREP